MDQQNNRLDTYLSMLRLLVSYSDLPDSRKNYYDQLLSVSRYSQITNEEAGELIGAFENAQVVLEKKILEHNDPENIEMLVDVKNFVADLMNAKEEQVLKDVLATSGDIGDNTYTSLNKSALLLDKLAGLVG